VKRIVIALSILAIPVAIGVWWADYCKQAEAQLMRFDA
jgi:hypothetical protein